MTETSAPLIPVAPPDEIALEARSAWRRVEPAVLGVAGIAGLLFAWQALPYVVQMKQGTKLFFTPPSDVAVTLWQLFASGEIWAPLGVSALGFAIGLAIAIAVGLPVGILIGRSETANALLDPFVTSFNATPRLVFLPLLMLWFGLGIWSKVAIVAFGAVFPLIINTHEGIRNADRLLINVVRSFGAKELDVIRLVVVPNALPYIITGLRLAIGRAVLGVVVSEFFGSSEGLGVMMVRAASQYKVNLVFAGMIVFMALSLAMTALVKMLETRLGRWRPQRASFNSQP